MNPNKERSLKQKLQVRNKTKLKIIITSSCILSLIIILLIYFNLTRIEEMKARNTSNTILIDRPVDMNVPKVKIDRVAANHREANYKIAKPVTKEN